MKKKLIVFGIASMILLMGITTVSIAKNTDSKTNMESQGLEGNNLQPSNVTIFFYVTVKNGASPVSGANIKIEAEWEDEWDLKKEGTTNWLGYCDLRIFHPGTFRVVAESEELGTLESEELSGEFEYHVKLNYNPLIKSKPATMPSLLNIFAKFFPLLQHLLKL
jgi:hypothetical protein